MKKLSIIIVAMLVAVSGLSAKGECKADREKHCPTVTKGDHKAMHECMKSHEAELSDACKTHRAETREKSKAVKKACKADFKKLCKDVKAGEGRIVKCLKAKDAELSAGCKEALSSTNIEH